MCVAASTASSAAAAPPSPAPIAAWKLPSATPSEPDARRTRRLTTVPPPPPPPAALAVARAVALALKALVLDVRAQLLDHPGEGGRRAAADVRRRGAQPRREHQVDIVLCAPRRRLGQREERASATLGRSRSSRGRRRRCAAPRRGRARRAPPCATARARGTTRGCRDRTRAARAARARSSAAAPEAAASAAASAASAPSAVPSTAALVAVRVAAAACSRTARGARAHRELREGARRRRRRHLAREDARAAVHVDPREARRRRLGEPFRREHALLRRGALRLDGRLVVELVLQRADDRRLAAARRAADDEEELDAARLPAHRRREEPADGGEAVLLGLRPARLEDRVVEQPVHLVERVPPLQPPRRRLALALRRRARRRSALLVEQRLDDAPRALPPAAPPRRVSSAAPAASHTECELSYRSAVGSGADHDHDVDDPVNAADGRRGGFERPPAALERAGGAPSGTREMFFIGETGVRNSGVRAQFLRPAVQANARTLPRLPFSDQRSRERRELDEIVRRRALDAARAVAIHHAAPHE